MTVPTKQGMQDQTSSNIARDGAAKRTQTSFPTHTGMKDPTSFSGSGAPINAGSGPDASAPNILSPEARGKKVQTHFPAKWGQTDGHKMGIDPGLAASVLADANK